LKALFLALAAIAVVCLANAAAGGVTPQLREQGETTQLIVDGKPFLILGGAS